MIDSASAHDGVGNLFDIAALDTRAEQFTPLVEAKNLKIERIVSAGQASPPGFWYDQDLAEWVLVLAGSAALRFEGEAHPRVLHPGDWLLIPAKQKHRVEWTDKSGATIWLAVHFS
ncbi:Cupin [Methylocella tundrae]|uniref:Cupin n=1 Tax=Methylocella tundrae TaxID=227605 RepID=A0A8B6M491_METTU|nr:cupin domain-containing protein [Methylocella tundrae]VTZ49615.1 Cupin [Methylocella tundrae]